MKRAILVTLLVGVLGAVVSLGSGCAATAGPSFERTRGHKAHTFRNRIHNPGDYRYTAR